MDNKVKTIKEDGTTIEIEVLDIFSVVGYEDKDYVLYTLGEEIDENNEKVYVSILENNNGIYNLVEIKDNNEWQLVQKAIEEASN